MSKELHTQSRTSRPNSLKCKQRGQSDFVTEDSSPRVPSVIIDPPALFGMEQCSPNKLDSGSFDSGYAQSRHSSGEFISDTMQYNITHTPRQGEIASLGSTLSFREEFEAECLSPRQFSVSTDALMDLMTDACDTNLAGGQKKYHTVSDGDSINSPNEQKPLEKCFSPRRVSITTEALADLMTAAMRVIDDVQSEPNLLESEKEEIEVDGPYRHKSSTWSGGSHHSSSSHLLGSRRLSAGHRGFALDHVPVQRRRSAQPFFHSFLHCREDNKQPASRNLTRKTSGCIICDRKHNQRFSAPSVIIKTSMSTKSRQRRRFSEALLVWTKCNRPGVELHVPRIDELVILKTQPKRSLLNTQCPIRPNNVSLSKNPSGFLIKSNDSAYISSQQESLIDDISHSHLPNLKSIPHTPDIHITSEGDVNDRSLKSRRQEGSPGPRLVSLNPNDTYRETLNTTDHNASLPKNQSVFLIKSNDSGYISSQWNSLSEDESDKMSQNGEARRPQYLELSDKNSEDMGAGIDSDCSDRSSMFVTPPTSLQTSSNNSVDDVLEGEAGIATEKPQNVKKNKEVLQEDSKSSRLETFDSMTSERDGPYSKAEKKLSTKSASVEVCLSCKAPIPQNLRRRSTDPLLPLVCNIKQSDHHTHENTLKEFVKINTAKFRDSTDFSMLLAHLNTEGLVHPGDSDFLSSPHLTLIDKANKFYCVVLDCKGPEAYTSLYKALKAEKQHKGHVHLVEMMEQGLGLSAVRDVMHQRLVNKTRQIEQSQADICPNVRLLKQDFARPFEIQQALKFAQPVPFIDPVDVFQITSDGGCYSNKDLGVCIDVPQGAVPIGSILNLEVGVSLYGPFEFPSDSTPISPILMLCPQGDVPLQKSVKVTLPHVIHEATDVDVQALGIRVIKADHRSLIFPTAGNNRCTFQDLNQEESDIHLYTRDGKGYATFSLAHFCFVSLRASSSIEVAKRKGYCVCPMYPSPALTATGTFTYHLCVTYFMDPCLKAIKKQFSKPGISEYNHELRKHTVKRFIFRDMDKASIQATIVEKDKIGGGWKVELDLSGIDGIQVITAASIDLWTKEQDDLEMEIENLMYPPCFLITAIGDGATGSAFVKLHFSTGSNDGFFMTLPLLKSSPVPLPLSPMKTGQKMTLKLLNEELRPLTRPSEFGAELGIPKNVLDKIAKDNPLDIDGQRLSLFGYITDNHNYHGITWMRIADALEAIHLGDLSLSIRAKYCLR